MARVVGKASQPLLSLRSVDGLTPSQKGAIAESAITAATIALGFTVLRPLCEGRRYDLVIDLEPRLLRVQCKLGQLIGGIVKIRLQSSRLTPAGYRRASYSRADVDAVAVYSAELCTSYLLPIAEAAGRNSMYLRLDPARNGQRLGIKWARDYELAKMLAAGRGALECS